MKNKIFSEMMGKQKPTKKWLFVPISFAFHVLLIAVMVIAPLLTADSHIPPIKTIAVTIANPSTLSLPVGRGGSHRSAGKSDVTSDSNKVRDTAPGRTNALVEPVNIPDEIEKEEFVNFDPTGFGSGDNLVDGALDNNGAPVLDTLARDNNRSSITQKLRVEQIPRLIKKVRPDYPDSALKSHVQGKVVIEAETDIYGRVKEMKVISGNPLLIPAALEAVKQWVYEPYIINGLPRPVWFAVTLEFTLTRR